MGKTEKKPGSSPVSNIRLQPRIRIAEFTTAAGELEYLFPGQRQRDLKWDSRECRLMLNDSVIALGEVKSDENGIRFVIRKMKEERT
ncbi:hypothetical protein [Salinispira pacifica]|uniref:Flagellar motor switch protein FliN-like C-terminal domain-containing protein n=1 Tax=Salinispira pacifica TaxID=1307761 RepID=V5WKN2_9SPIO|nr:hypothetical protein [Salinispira pacifica]AHC16099.1 hypothetical protein L21SP2_2749 [Salinispira pacifica]